MKRGNIMKTRTIKKLQDHPSSQCEIYIENGGNLIHFISYATRVITLQFKEGKRFVECTGTYSSTTRRQIGWFLREYAPDLSYQDMKAIAEQGLTTC